jgi:predicted permease
MGDFWQDLKFGVRTLRKSPGFVLIALITLALGIGANAAIFSVVNGVLLRPLPYPNPGQLVSVYTILPELPKFSVSVADFKDFMDRQSVFSSAALYAQRDLDLTTNGVPQHLSGMGVSNGYFQTLGYRPTLGRDFSLSDDTKGNNRVAILSDRLWREKFSADPNVVGRAVKLSGELFTVIGVMPPGVQHVGGNYRSVGQGDTVDLWWALPLWPAKTDGCDRQCHYLNMIARLQPHVTLAQAQSQMTLLAANIAHENKLDDDGLQDRVSLIPLKEDVVGRARQMLVVVMGAVGFLLLIACVNVANLSLARAAGRQREIAMRSVLGASRFRIVRQLLAESLLLAIAGCALGVLIANWGIAGLLALAPEQFPRVAAVHMDARVLAFAVFATLSTAILFGLFPALSIPQADVNSTLKDGDRGSTHSGHMRLRSWLAVAEIALALVVLVGAGLLARTFYNLQRVNAGFQSDHVLTFELDVPQARYGDDPKYIAFYRQLISRLQALPGVETAGVTSDLPWTGYDENLTFHLAGHSHTDPKQSRYHYVSPEYFRTVRTPLISGRFFAETDDAKAQPVILVNQALAQRYFPNGDAVGTFVTVFNEVKMQIIGVVGNVQDTPSSTDAKPALYLNSWQLAAGGEQFIAVRSTGDTRALAAQVAREVAAIDPDLPVMKVRPLEDVSALAISGTRFTLTLVGMFGAIALILAAVGVFGVISYSVTQRTNEIGIRIALGALQKDVLSMILGQGSRIALAGIFLGLVAAALLTRAMQTLLFNVSPFDPITLAAVAALLVFVALLACYFPARRAAQVDPMVALRHE